MTGAGMGHNYLVAAFCVTWVIQLGYAVWIGVKWLRQKPALKNKGVGN